MLKKHQLSEGRFLPGKGVAWRRVLDGYPDIWGVIVGIAPLSIPKTKSDNIDGEVHPEHRW